MKFHCTCVVCKNQFVTQWKTATCGSSACRDGLGSKEEERFFFDRVSKRQDGCWEWLGGCDKQGNPVVNFKKKVLTAYKFYKKFMQGIDIGMNRLTRSCGFQKCVNPDHFMNDWDRLQSRIIHAESGCHLWTAAKDEDGYAIGTLDGKSGRLSRILWEKLKGRIGDARLQVCHVCDTPACVCVDHFFLGTAKDNSDDKRKKGREARGEKTMIAVLDEASVFTARQMRDSGLSFPEITKRLGSSVSESAVRSACIGRTWQHVGGPFCEVLTNRGQKIDPELAIKIRAMAASGDSPGIIALKLNLDCCEQTIRNVISGASWAHVA